MYVLQAYVPALAGLIVVCLVNFCKIEVTPDMGVSAGGIQMWYGTTGTQDTPDKSRSGE